MKKYGFSFICDSPPALTASLQTLQMKTYEHKECHTGNSIAQFQCFVSVFIEPGSSQKSQSGSRRRPINPDPDPSYCLTISANDVKLFHNFKRFSHQKESIERYKVIKEKNFAMI